MPRKTKKYRENSPIIASDQQEKSPIDNNNKPNPNNKKEEKEEFDKTTDGQKQKQQQLIHADIDDKSYRTELHWHFPFVYDKSNPMRNKVYTFSRKLNMDEFISIWQSLHTIVKERIFLYLHMVLYDMANRDAPNNNRHMNFAVNQQVWLLRQTFLCNNNVLKNDDDEKIQLRHHFECLMCNDSEQKKWFNKIGMTPRIPYDGDSDRAEDQRYLNFVHLSARKCGQFFMSALQFVLEYLKKCDDQEKWFKKARAVAPRWTDHYRPYLLGGIEFKKETKVINCMKAYLDCLRTVYSPKKYLHLVYGKLKMCGTCGATNREKFLFTCKKCESDGVRPKQRYCSVQCQRADWIMHRENVHSIKEKEDK